MLSYLVIKKGLIMKRILKVGFDLDGVILYNPIRFVRPIAKLLKPFKSFNKLVRSNCVECKFSAVFFPKSVAYVSASTIAFSILSISSNFKGSVHRKLTEPGLIWFPEISVFFSSGSES